MKKLTALLLSLAMVLALAACGGGAGGAAELNVGVFYYNYSDPYITTVRAAMDAKLTAAGIPFTDYDGNTNQGNQLDQVNTAITGGANLLVVNVVDTASDAAQQICGVAKDAGIPIIFFNREVENSVVNSYENCAFVGTDAPEAGHMQGEMIGDYLLEHYDAADLNGDGAITYVMFKGQEGNKEAEFRTRYAVEDADAKLTAAGRSALAFYDAGNSSKYLLDPDGAWSAKAATDHMTTILASYSEANGNMVELVIANNDDMAKGAVAALQNTGYNTGEDGAPAIPVYGVDAMDDMVQMIKEGKAAGTVKQDGGKMADTIVALVQNVASGAALMDNTSGFNVDADCAKIRVPYAKVDAANA